jgi:3-deoxy-D-manno-octulosonate 8-phosphate phosphatase (KDO 8-P phosphatase)
MFLEQNIKGLCKKHGLKYDDFLSDLEVDHIHEITLFDLEAIAEEYELSLEALLFKSMFPKDNWGSKTTKIKLLVLDVDGVMTDGGMYFTESGDQIKKYNTKDGMAIRHLTKSGFPVAIISSGFTQKVVEERAKMLEIQHCYVGREPKMTILKQFCETLNISLKEVAMIGDDVNDLEVFEQIGFTACPKDAVQKVKSKAHIILSAKGGEGCVREFIDNYLLPQAMG